VIGTDDEAINVDNPDDNNIQVVVNENENQNEMDEVVVVPLENGENDTPTIGDVSSDSLTITQ
jgi:hypothetical protein